MADGDNRVSMGGSGGAAINRELGPDTSKANPTAMTRTAEAEDRAQYYAGSGKKDSLPEHQARRDKLPHITAASA